MNKFTVIMVGLTMSSSLLNGASKPELKKILEIGAPQFVSGGSTSHVIDIPPIVAVPQILPSATTSPCKIKMEYANGFFSRWNEWFNNKPAAIQNKSGHDCTCFFLRVKTSGRELGLTFSIPLLAGKALWLQKLPNEVYGDIDFRTAREVIVVGTRDVRANLIFQPHMARFAVSPGTIYTVKRKD